MKTRAWTGLALIGMGVAMCLMPAQAAEQAEEDAAVTTEITSDRLLFDYKKKLAVFEDNVVVVDPRLRLTARRLTVTFDDNNNAQTILAEGQVVITQEDKRAMSDKATYDVATGQIVLEGRPKIQRGSDTLEGTKITFWRDQNRLICQPGARLVIHPQKGGARDQILGTSP